MLIRILSKSLRETFRPKRFLPFFLLYALFSISMFLLIAMVLKAFPNLTNAVSLVTINLSAAFIVLLIVILANLWFTGALIYDGIKNKGFDAALNYSKKIYMQILILSIVILFLSMFVSFIPFLGVLLAVLVEWAFFFSLPAVVLKKDSFDTALIRSYNIVRNRARNTFVFYLAVKLISLIFFFIGIVFVVLPLLPLSQEFYEILLTFQIAPEQHLTQLAYLILQNHTSLLLALVIGSFFYAIMHVFNYLSRTYYFAALKRQKY